MNQRHIQFWKDQKPEDIETDRARYLRVLVDQDVELTNTPIKAWLEIGCRTVVRHSRGDPIDCDVLMIRAGPCKKSASHGGDSHWKDEKNPDFKTDHLGWIDALRRKGLDTERHPTHTLHYSPFYFANKPHRGFGSKTTRNILGWRFSLAVWLIRPKYILATNMIVSKFVHAGFDSRKYETKPQMDWNYMLSIRYGPPAFRSGKIVVSRAIRISHPYQFAPENTKIDMQARERFEDVVRFLNACFGEEESIKDKRNATDLSAALIEAALTRSQTSPFGNTEAEIPATEECPCPPYWLSVKDWHMFSEPVTGRCECAECGGCGAQQCARVDQSLFAHDTLFPPRSTYKVEWTELADVACDRCQCIDHGHRSLDFNECIQGCPVGGFVNEVHGKLLSMTERYEPDDFLEWLIHDPGTFGNPQMVEMLTL